MFPERFISAICDARHRWANRIVWLSYAIVSFSYAIVSRSDRIVSRSDSPVPGADFDIYCFDCIVYSKFEEYRALSKLMAEHGQK
jgi:hypothetical protein